MFSLAARLNLQHVTLDLYLIYVIKFFYHKLPLKRTQKRQTLIIIGCQRSGTSLINRIFARDLNVSVYRESSVLSSADPNPVSRYRLRLNDYDQIRKKLDSDHASLRVLKPLVETQNIIQIFDALPESKALWMFRHYKDVSCSILNKFSVNAGIRNLKAIAENDQTMWAAEHVSDEVRAIVQEYYSPDMNPYDAAALFWYARNTLFYELSLDHNLRVFMCRYEDLATEPNTMMSSIYQFVDATYQNSKRSQEVHSNSVKKGESIQLSAPIETLCHELWSRLNASYAAQAEQYHQSSPDLALSI